MFSLKNMNFCVLNFALSKNSENLNLCVCVRACVCVCECVCVYVYVCDKSKHWYSCNMQNKISRITLRNVTKFQKFRNWKFKKFITYTRCKTLPAWNVVKFPRRLKYCIHQNSHENALFYALSFNYFMPGGYIRSYKHINKAAAKSCRFL